MNVILSYIGLFFQGKGSIRDFWLARGVGDVYKGPDKYNALDTLRDRLTQARQPGIPHEQHGILKDSGLGQTPTPPLNTSTTTSTTALAKSQTKADARAILKGEQ